MLRSVPIPSYPSSTAACRPTGASALKWLPTARLGSLLIGCFAAACDDGGTPRPTEPLPEAPTAVSLYDEGNAQNASDFAVEFVLGGDLSVVTGARVVLLAEGSTPLTDESARGLPSPDRYEEELATTPLMRIPLRAGLLDVDGNAVLPGASYRAQVVSVLGGGSTLASEPGAATVLEITDLVETFGGSFSASGGVAVSDQGLIYVADFGTTLQTPNGTRVHELTPEGERRVFADGLSGASGNAFDIDGVLYQSSIAAGTVSAISPAGVVSPHSSGHAGPVGIAALSDGTLFVSNCNGNSIRRVTPSGNASVYASGAPLSCPNGIAADADGNLYPVNFNDGRVLKITPNGAMTTLATIAGGGNGHVTFANSRLYVVDRSGHGVWEVTLDGSVRRIAGSGSRGKRDGAALAAEFSLPNGIAASASGDTLYVNDVLATTGTGLNPVVMRRIILDQSKGAAGS